MNLNPSENLAMPLSVPATGRAALAPSRSDGARPAGLSYKFQRLRERLRSAILAGEFAKKLPGERALAKRFGVNAKTLSKALTDLAAEGLLDRSIGRGTFVKGTAPAAGARGRWLLLAGPGDLDTGLLECLRQANPDIEILTDVSQVRPSFLNQFSAVIDAAARTPEPFLRDLVVRNLPVVALGREPRTFSVHAVLLDKALAASRLARDLCLSGYRRLAAVEPPGSTLLAQTLRQSARRYAPDVVVEACAAEDIAAMLGDGSMAIVCESIDAAQRVRATLDRCGKSVPAHVSLAAIGCSYGAPPCSGYFCEGRQLVDSIDRLLRDNPLRPATLWLAGAFIDRGTLAPAPGELAGQGLPLQLAGMLV